MKAVEETRLKERRLVREIELRGHILDSGVFGRVLALIMDNEHARYTIDNFTVGHTSNDQSTALLTLEADTIEHLDALVEKLRSVGVTVLEDSDATTEPAPLDGVLPDTFYATTNLVTEVRLGGEWIPVALPEMDCAIVLSGKTARTVPLRRMGTKDELADLALYLCSDAASYITGGIYVCDGGMSLARSGFALER